MASLADRTSRELAELGHCQVAGLLDAFGRLVRACLARPDSDPVFCGLLDGRGGAAERAGFATELMGIAAQGQRYRQNTAVVETVPSDAAINPLRLTDFCPRFRERGRVFKPMTFIRIVEPQPGRARVRLRFKRVNY